MGSAFWTRAEQALAGGSAGLFGAPALGGSSGIDIPGVTGGPRPREGPPVVTADAPGIPVDEVHLVALADGTLVVDEDVPDGSLEPLAAVVEERIPPPYRALAIRQEADVWAVAAEQVAVVDLTGDDEAGVIEVSSLDGRLTYTVDGEPAALRFPELEEIGREAGDDYAVRAERIEADTWVVDAWPL
jgi:hypothetical protein